MKQFSSILILILLTSCTDHGTGHIGIQPYGHVDSAILDSISSVLELSYQTEVVILEEKPLPRSAFINVKSPRYRADSLLRHLRANKPDSLSYIIGITSKDISTTKTDRFGNVKKPESKYADWGIFGLGFRPGPSCIVSTFRLKHDNRQRFYSRIQKVAVHEIGHNKGLKHCDTKGCVMQDAVESIRTLDEEGIDLCEECQANIR